MRRGFLENLFLTSFAARACTDELNPAHPKVENRARSWPESVDFNRLAGRASRTARARFGRGTTGGGEMTIWRSASGQRTYLSPRAGDASIFASEGPTMARGIGIVSLALAVSVFGVGNAKA